MKRVTGIGGMTVWNVSAADGDYKVELWQAPDGQR